METEPLDGVDLEQTPQGKTEHEKMCADFHTVFGSDVGARVLEHIKGFCCIYETTVDANPFATHHNEGMRSVALSIQRYIDNHNV